MLTYEVTLTLLFVGIAILDATIVMRWFRNRNLLSLMLGVFVNLFSFIETAIGLSVMDGYVFEGMVGAWVKKPLFLHILYPIMLIVYSMGILVYEIGYQRRKINRSSIQHAINELDCGLMYVVPEGTITLMNRCMERLAIEMFDDYPYNGNEFWTNIISLNYNSQCRRIDFSQWPAFLFTNGEVWSFQKQLINDDDRSYMEIIAKNMTDLYKKRKDAENEINKLKALQEKLSRVLKNISEAGNEEELLNYKIRIHDQLGNAIVRTRKTLRDGDYCQENVEGILNVWENTVKAFEQNALEATALDQGSMEEVYEQAKSLGIKLEVKGKFPANIPVCVRTVREAMYNSVRHAFANEVIVESYLAGDGYHIKISDDGTAEIDNIKEGGGLSSLRQAIEEEGGELLITGVHGLVLNVFWPIAIGRTEQV